MDFAARLRTYFRPAVAPAPPTPLLVLVHGFLGSSADWDGVARYLAAYPRATLDLPGHGASLDLPEHAYTLDGAADALVATLDAPRADTPGLGPAILVGYSMGGRVALTAALRHPSRFRALVLESASPGLRTAEERTARLAVDADRASRLAADPARFLAAWYRMPLFASLAETPGRVEALIAERERGDAQEHARALRGLSVAHQPSYWDDLDRLPPTLALAGARDAKYVGLATAMAEASSVTACVVPEAGHNVHRERPAAFARAVTSWLATLDAV